MSTDAMLPNAQFSQTWKNHFCSGLATCDPKFTLTEWDLLMP